MLRAFAFATVMFGSATAAAAPFSDIIVFGDSLSDTGNAQIGAAVLGLGDPTPASAGYFQGRFSNGPIYLDYLHDQLIGGPSLPAAPRLFGLPAPSGENFAVGGARAVTNADPSLDFAEQLGLYTADRASRGLPQADPEALYVVNFGSNDVRAVVQGAADASALEASAATVVAFSNLLVGAGARNLLIMNVGDLGSEPVFNGLESEARAASEAFNAALESALGFGETGTYEFGDVTVTYFDTFEWGDAVIADPAAFGLPADIDLETPCFAVPSALPDCVGYAWADTIHPSSSIHLALGQSLLPLLQQVPAPAGLALFGLGALALGLRRRA